LVVVEPQSPDEVLEPEADWPDPLLDGLWRSLLRRPFALPVLIVLTLGLVGAGAAVLAQRGPKLARVSVPAGGSTTQDAPWQPGANDRPGPVVLSVWLMIRRGVSGSPTSVVGITGPGIMKTYNPAVVLPIGRLAKVPLQAGVDCAALPAAVPKGAYGLQIRARSGTEAKTAVVGVGAVGNNWAGIIRVACASWSARRDLTVTALTARVHPTLSRLDLSFTVTNSGDRPGTLNSTAGPGGPDTPIRLEGALPILVPARASVQASLTVVLDTCDSVPQKRDQTSPPTVDQRLSTQFELAGLVGPVPAVRPTIEGYGDGFDSTGILIAPAAAKVLTSAFQQACAGLGPILTLVEPGSVRYSATTRELTLPLLIDVTPGRVRSLRLTPAPADGGPFPSYQPLWTSTRALVPDSSGQVRVTLHYRAPESGACPDRGAYLPGFLAHLTAPVAGVDRRVNYSGMLDLADADPLATRTLCPSP
jgi:hypothetical protein